MSSYQRWDEASEQQQSEHIQDALTAIGNSINADGTLKTAAVQAANGGSLPSGGNVGDMITNSAPGAGIWTPVDSTVTPADIGAVDVTIFDAKGDLLVGTGPDAAAKLTAGTNGQALVADSTQATGLKYADITSLSDIFLTGAGWLSANGSPATFLSAQALTAGTIYCTGIPLRAGMVVNNIGFFVTAAAVGTAPTAFFVGLASKTAMLQQSTDQKVAMLALGLGPGVIPLQAAYTVPADDLYYIMLLQVGSWGTTQPTFGRTGLLTNLENAVAGGSKIGATAGTGQTALPANDATPTYTGNHNFLMFAGVT